MTRPAARWGALVTAAVIVVAAAVAVFARGGGGDRRDEPPRLRLLAQGIATAGDAERSAAESTPSGVADTWVDLDLVPPDDMPELGGAAPAYRVGAGASRAAFAELMDAFGSEIVEDEGGLHARSGAVSADMMPEGVWNVYRDDAVPTTVDTRVASTAADGPGPEDLPVPIESGGAATPVAGLPGEDAAPSSPCLTPPAGPDGPRSGDGPGGRGLSG